MKGCPACGDAPLTYEIERGLWTVQCADDEHMVCTYGNSRTQARERWDAMPRVEVKAT